MPDDLGDIHEGSPERRKVIEETCGHCARARPCIEYLPVELHCLEEGHHLPGLRPGHGVHGLKVLAYPSVLFFGSLVNRAFQDPSTGPQDNSSAQSSGPTDPAARG